MRQRYLLLWVGGVGHLTGVSFLYKRDKTWILPAGSPLEPRLQRRAHGLRTAKWTLGAPDRYEDFQLIVGKSVVPSYTDRVDVGVYPLENDDCLGLVHQL
jgi:hypothetical protein